MFAILVLAGCAAGSPPDPPPSCWVLTGRGYVGDMGEGYLCLVGENACWRCVVLPEASLSEPHEE